MKLTELDPRWLIGRFWEPTDNPLVTSGRQVGLVEKRHGMGLSFLCPVHRDHRLAVFFTNPIDGGIAAEAKYTWQRTGDSFETMTLGPSVDASGNVFPCHSADAGMIQTPCWHGFITNGEIR